MDAELPTELTNWLAAPCENGSPAMGRTQADLPVLVVGAGPAGLAAMAALSQRGVAFEGIESHTRLGGIWDESNPVSSVYDGLHMVTSRLTANLGPAMPTEWPKYPHHRQAHEYLAKFAESERILPHIRFATHFVTAEKTPHGSWLATLRAARAPMATARKLISKNFGALWSPQVRIIGAISCFPKRCGIRLPPRGSM